MKSETLNIILCSSNNTRVLLVEIIPLNHSCQDIYENAEFRVIPSSLVLSSVISF